MRKFVVKTIVFIFSFMFIVTISFSAIYFHFSKHPFRKSQEVKEKIKMHHLDEKDMISKDQYDFEMSEEESTIDSINSDNEIPDGIEVD